MQVKACFGMPFRRQTWLNLLMSQFNGLESNIYETGRNLSSGQIQRIALARAFLRDAPVLVMDEPTAHLDPDLEKNLNAAILELVKNRTVLVIAHRMPTILHADQVVLLDSGKVVESGSPASLLEQGGYFSSMVQHLKTGNPLRDITAGAL